MKGISLVSGGGGGGGGAVTDREGEKCQRELGRDIELPSFCSAMRQNPGTDESALTFAKKERDGNKGGTLAN